MSTNAQADALVRLIWQHALTFQWDNPNDTAPETFEELDSDDVDPCSLIVTSQVTGTSWSVDYEDTPEGRERAIEQLLLDAAEHFEFNPEAIDAQMERLDQGMFDADNPEASLPLMEDEDEDDESESETHNQF